MKPHSFSEPEFAVKPLKVFNNRLQQWWLSMDESYGIGLAAYVVSIVWLVIAQSYDQSSRNLDIYFFINYSIAIGYTFYLLRIGKMKVFWRRQPVESLPHRLLCWWIWIVSCFSLNRSFAIFQESTLWLSVILVFSGVLGVIYSGLPFFSHQFRSFFYYCWGSSLCLWLYFTGYLLWLYPISVIALLFFGLGFHTFVSLFLLIAHFKIAKLGLQQVGKIAMLFAVGSPLLVVGIIITSWVVTVQHLNTTYSSLDVNTSDDLPTWVKVAQKVDKSWLTERILKSNLVYQVPGNRLNLFPTSTNSEQLLRHDPLVFLGSLWAKPAFTQQESIKIIESLYDARHYTQERLWTGRHLSTDEVITHTRLYPSFRLAYTEKTLTVKNTAPSLQEEALYTFYLSEGSVVTSLSLWINGKEEKGYLTTQSKADSAYRTIVGRESRDPSVVHWQEGNTVIVRVFPCTARENRRFKIGVTSPLRLQDGELVYENISFKGPDNTQTSETVRVESFEKLEGLKSPWKAETESLITHQSRYTPNWSIRFHAGPLSAEEFTFQGKTYHLEAQAAAYEIFRPTEIYADIHEAWKWSEFETLCQQFKDRNIWVYDDRLVLITPENAKTLFKKLAQNRFSLFPVYHISTPAQALIITKGVDTTPLLKEIKESIFAQNLQKTASHMTPIRTFCLNENVSPFFKTLHELRLVTVDYGSMNDLQTLIRKSHFKTIPERLSEKIALIESAHVLIRQRNITATTKNKSAAPNHLARLYAYNYILQQIGAQYFQRDSLAASLVTEAAQANVVTPVSSLVVLETQGDYQRFDIKKSINSLENATNKKSGSIPEPHEWTLVILLIGLIMYAWIRPNGHLF